MLPAYPQTIVAAFHGGGAFSDFIGNGVVSTFPNAEFCVFPDGLGYPVHILQVLDTIEKHYIEQPETPVVVIIDSKTWDPISRIVNLTLTFNNDGYGGDLQGSYWYNVMITEDNIIASHYTRPHCSTPNSIYGPDADTLYDNDWVTRKLLYLSEGRFLVGPTWPDQQEITIIDTINISQAWAAENCNIVVNVYKKADSLSLYQSPVMQAIKEPLMDLSGLSDHTFVENDIIEVFPNPAANITNIHFALLNNEKCSLDVYDFNGKKMKSLVQGNIKKGLYNIELQTDEIAGGTYMIVLKTSK